MTKYLTQRSKIALRGIMWASLLGLCAAVLSLAAVFLYLDPQIPKAETYRNVKLETPLRVYAKDGELLAEFGERRLIPITLDQVPKHFINALLDTEDKRFYQHSGIDFISLTNDVFGLIGTLLTEGELGPGASTITMQLARNVSFSLERRFLRKFKEMLLALKIERELSKDEILELYINLVPFGKRAYGAEAAARTYYGKPLAQLTLPQLAMLAGIPQRPSAANPINGPRAALARRNLVLSRMREQESITDSEFQAAYQTELSADIYARELDLPSPYSAEWVRQDAVRFINDLYTGGYEIYTTIDAKLQRQAIESLRRGLIQYDRRHGYRGAEGALDEALLTTLVNNRTNDLIPASVAPSESTLSDGDVDAGLDVGLDAADSSVSNVTLPDELANALSDYLAKQKIYNDLIPAVVIDVQPESLTALTNDGKQIRLALEENRWARPFIHVDRRGPTPKQWQEIIQLGDLIRVVETDEGWQLSQLPEIQGALVALDPRDGKVRALVGGFDFYANQYNHALQAARQPGSGFKPFVYSAALDAGVTPATTFLDAPLVFQDKELEQTYKPNNDNDRYNGPTRLREALYRSINLVSMRVLQTVGAGQVIEHASKFGFGIRDFPRNTQLAIGGGTMAITPIDMARAYSVLANGGYLIEPHALDRIYDADGNNIFVASHPEVCPDCDDAPTVDASDSFETALDPDAAEPATLEELLASADDVDEDEAELELIPATRVLDERNAYVMHSMLQDVIKRGTGRRARSLKRDDLAGKTGTTNEAADTWFNGFHPNLVASVWVGFSNHEPLGAREYGANTALPIWTDFMATALEDLPETSLAQPAGIVTLKIDPETGEPAAPSDRSAIFEIFLEEYAPEPQENSEVKQSKEVEEINPVELF